MRLLDDQTFELLDRLRLQPHELACSVTRWALTAICRSVGSTGRSRAIGLDRRCMHVRGKPSARQRFPPSQPASMAGINGAAAAAVLQCRGACSQLHLLTCALCRCSTRLGDDPTVYYVVGTAFALPNEPESTKVVWRGLKGRCGVPSGVETGVLQRVGDGRCIVFELCPQPSASTSGPAPAPSVCAGPHFRAARPGGQVQGRLREGKPAAARRAALRCAALRCAASHAGCFTGTRPFAGRPCLGPAKASPVPHAGKGLFTRPGVCLPPELASVPSPGVLQETRGAVYTLCEFQGRLLAGINSRVQMYK